MSWKYIKRVLENSQMESLSFVSIIWQHAYLGHFFSIIFSQPHAGGLVEHLRYVSYTLLLTSCNAIYK